MNSTRKDISFGFQASPASGTPTSDRALYDGVMEECDFSSNLGYETAWMIEHHFSDYFPCPSPLIFLSHVARAFPKLGLGSAVLVLPWYHPVRLAGEIAMLSNLTDAPLYIGLGRGTAKFEYDSFSVDMSDARERFAESVAILKTALYQDEFTYQGKYFSVPWPISLRPTPDRKKIQMFGAIGSPGSATIMAEMGLPPLGIANFPDHHLTGILNNWTNRTTELGLDTNSPKPLLVRLLQAETDEEAIARARKYYPPYFELQCRHYRTDNNPWDGLEEYKEFTRIFSNLKKMTNPDNLGPFMTQNLIGSKETVARRLGELVDMGWDSFCITTALPSTPLEIRRESATRFAQDVAPLFSSRFRKAGTAASELVGAA